MAKIIDVQTRFPGHRYSQKEIVDYLAEFWPSHGQRLRSFHQNVGVGERSFALPLESYPQLGDFGQRCEIWKDLSLELLRGALDGLFTKGEVTANDIDFMASNSITGLSIPSLEALLMNVFPFPTGMKRLPLFGLGCLGGVAGVNRVHDYLKGHPDEAALFLSSELCSLTFQLHDKSIANMISTGLFADAVAAVLIVGDEHPLAENRGLRILDEKSFFYPDTERTMGWDIKGSGFQIVLSGNVPEIVKEHLPANANEFLTSHDFSLADLSFVLAHPGGPKVLETVEESLSFKQNQLQRSWESLKERGNLSSVSLLHIMEKFFTEERENGEHGLMFAMGPAFCSEFGLLKWEGPS